MKDFKRYKDASDILTACEEIISLEPKLDEILGEIATLRRGSVKPNETLRRSKVGSFVSEELQQISNLVVKDNISLPKQIKEKALLVREKAEKVLRENIILQTKPPLDVVRFSDVPVRYVYSFFWRT